MPRTTTQKSDSNKVLFSGGPGAGKTTLLVTLGLPYRDDQARAIICRRQRAGLAPRPDPLSFAQEILRREIESYETAAADRLVLFDRGMPDALAQVVEAGGMTVQDAQDKLAAYPHYPRAFMLPPWESIYRTDSERDQTFYEAKAGYDWAVGWYQTFGFQCIEVPIGPVDKRAAFIQQQLPNDWRQQP